MENQNIMTRSPARSIAGTKSEISIILVCWNNKSYLEPCLKSLYDANITADFEIIVVDNGSTDGSQSMLRENYPQVMIIQNDHNVGLSRASNQGIEATHGNFVLLLNNDTLVNGSSLNRMISFIQSMPDAGAVGGRLLNEDGSFQAGYADFSTVFEEFLITTRIGELIKPGYPSHLDSEEVKQVGWLSSACLLLRRAALDEIGLLDEEYFIYGDEADLQYRLQQAGWKVYYLPDVTTLHYGGRSMNRWRRRKMVYRGKLLFYRKNYGWFRSVILRMLFGSLSFMKLISWSVLSIFPSKREQAKLELSSNIDVLKLCLKLA